MGLDLPTLLDNAKERLSKIVSNEEKIIFLLEQMKQGLAEQEKPNFGFFWELRALCVSCFKGPLSPASRIKLWKEFTTLSSEVRQLSDFLHEEAFFAIEQIDLALQALENSVENKAQSLAKMKEIVLPRVEYISKDAFYADIQKELSLYIHFAARIQELRREVVQQPFRAKHKNQFFKRLSKLGDHVFSQRKILMHEIGTSFQEDVGRFIENYFGEKKQHRPFYLLREDIKNLQAMTKSLSLETSLFSKIREDLSRCWDTVRTWDEERKRRLDAKNRDLRNIFEEKIEKIKKKMDQNSSQENGIKDLRYLQEELAKSSLWEKEKEGLEKKLSSLLPKEKPVATHPTEQVMEKVVSVEDPKEKQKDMEQQLRQLFEKGESQNLQDLLEVYDSIQEQGEGFEKKHIAPLILAIEDLLEAKKEEAELSQTTNMVDAFSRVLQKRIERKNKIKHALEIYRKTLGGTSFDFEKGLQFQEYVTMCKSRLEKVNRGIDDLEKKLADLES
ncbi:MAG: hypothetical protein JW769_04340 [Parachlamydiales bacterium]|nr:hypothetical protein [Parachlamydiales bacterium]